MTITSSYQLVRHWIPPTSRFTQQQRIGIYESPSSQNSPPIFCFSGGRFATYRLFQANSSHQKMGWLEYSFPFRMIYFQGRSVSFRQCTVCFCWGRVNSQNPPNFVVEHNCRFPIPSRFRGQYADDQKHGFGTFTWQAGEGGPVGDEDRWLWLEKT